MDCLLIKNGKGFIFNERRYCRITHNGNAYFINKRKDDKKRYLHRDVWQYYNGEIPEGCVVHHKDSNTENNNIDNLQMLTTKEHDLLHGELTRKKCKEDVDFYNMKLNCIDIANIEVKKWHKTEAGKLCHSKQMKKRWENKQPNKYICTQCKIEYLTCHDYSKNKNTFCSHLCAEKWLRYAPENQITKNCKHCGKEFQHSKRDHPACCSMSCAVTYGKKDKKIIEFKNCAYCGKEFQVVRKHKNVIHCSKTCSNLNNPRLPHLRKKKLNSVIS